MQFIAHSAISWIWANHLTGLHCHWGSYFASYCRRECIFAM